MNCAFWRFRARTRRPCHPNLPLRRGHSAATSTATALASRAIQIQPTNRLYRRFSDPKAWLRTDLDPVRVTEVAPEAAHETIVAAAAVVRGHEVVAGTALQHVVPRAPVQEVLARIAQQ